MKILITGICGTGKSTISKALKDRGILSVDFSDVRGMCYWKDLKTEERVSYSPIESLGWFKNKSYFCDLTKLKEVLNQHESVVITGVASGSTMEYLPLFDKVILLQCSPEVFTHRMRTRTALYGKTKAEQEDAIKWQKEFDPLLLSHGAIPVNTEGEISDVVDKIVAQIHSFIL